MTTNNTSSGGAGGAPPPRQPALPTVPQLEDALKRLEYVWALVPSGVRPVSQHKRIKEDLHKTLARVLAFALARGTQLALLDARAEGEDGGENGDVLEQPAIALIHGLLRTLDDEQVAQVRILLDIRENLSEPARAELFDELIESYHVPCGAELYEDMVHECPVADEANGAEVGPAVLPAAAHAPGPETEPSPPSVDSTPTPEAT